MKKVLAFYMLLFAAFVLSGCVSQSLDGNQQSGPQTSSGPESEGQVTESRDCGTLDNMHLLAVDEQTDTEKVALECFNNKMLACSPGSIELTGQGGRTISVEGKEGANCTISFSDVSETKSCKIPQSFIADAGALAEGEGKQGNMLIAVSFGMVAGTVQNTETGETIAIECD